MSVVSAAGNTTKEIVDTSDLRDGKKYQRYSKPIKFQLV